MSYNHYVIVNAKITGNIDDDTEYIYEIQTKPSVRFVFKKSCVLIEYNRNTYDGDKKIKDLYNEYSNGSENARKKLIEVETDYGMFCVAMRKMYIVYALIYGRGIDVYSIKFGLNEDERYSVECTIEDEGFSGFPYIVSTISTSDLGISELFKNKIPEFVIHTKTDEEFKNKAIIALSSYLQSKNRNHEIDRLVNLWASMNALYGELVDRYNQSVENWINNNFEEGSKVNVIFQTNEGNMNLNKYFSIKEDGDRQGQKLLKYILSEKLCLKQDYKDSKHEGFDAIFKRKKTKTNFIDIFKHVAKYEYDDGRWKISFSDLYDKIIECSRCEGNQREFEQCYPKIKKWAETYFKDRNLYFTILIDLSYYLRNQVVHGNFTNLTTYDGRGYLNNIFALVNYFMDRFLTENLTLILFENGEELDGESRYMDDETFEKCRKWLIDRRKIKSTTISNVESSNMLELLKTIYNV